MWGYTLNKLSYSIKQNRPLRTILNNLLLSQNKNYCGGIDDFVLSIIARLSKQQKNNKLSYDVLEDSLLIEDLLIRSKHSSVFKSIT
ncbi:MAG: hypothetical protein ACW964_09750 [Candidatus Hodarchaeales archaeon]